MAAVIQSPDRARGRGSRISRHRARCGLSTRLKSSIASGCEPEKVGLDPEGRLTRATLKRTRCSASARTGEQENSGVRLLAGHSYQSSLCRALDNGLLRQRDSPSCAPDAACSLACGTAYLGRNSSPHAARLACNLPSGTPNAACTLACGTAYLGRSSSPHAARFACNLPSDTPNAACTLAHSAACTSSGPARRPSRLSFRLSHEVPPRMSSLQARCRVSSDESAHVYPGRNFHCGTRRREAYTPQSPTESFKRMSLPGHDLNRHAMLPNAPSSGHRSSNIVIA